MFKLKGVIPPMITPFDERGELNLAGLEGLVKFLSQYVHGLFICGSYGSGPMMSVEERKLVAETAVKAAVRAISKILQTTNLMVLWGRRQCGYRPGSWAARPLLRGWGMCSPSCA